MMKRINPLSNLIRSRKSEEYFTMWYMSNRMSVIYKKSSLCKTFTITSLSKPTAFFTLICNSIKLDTDPVHDYLYRRSVHTIKMKERGMKWTSY